nr:hypothetical protein BaRGS_018381 [Batillaria attramentaria]
MVGNPHCDQPLENFTSAGSWGSVPGVQVLGILGSRSWGSWGSAGPWGSGPGAPGVQVLAGVRVLAGVPGVQVLGFLGVQILGFQGLRSWGECITYESELKSRPDLTHRVMYKSSPLPPGYIITSMELDASRQRSFYWVLNPTLACSVLWMKNLSTSLGARHAELGIRHTELGIRHTELGIRHWAD